MKVLWTDGEAQKETDKWIWVAKAVLWETLPEDFPVQETMERIIGNKDVPKEQRQSPTKPFKRKLIMAASG